MADQEGVPREKTTLGGRLRELRLRRGWTQHQLAESAGLQQKQISAYERGATIPSSQTLITLGSALEVSLDDLVQISPHGSARRPISDRDLLEKVHRVDELTELDRRLVKDVMDLVLFRSTGGYGSTMVGPAMAEERRTDSCSPGAAKELDPVKRAARKMGWDEGRLREEIKSARRDVRELLKLDPGERVDRIHRANSRFEGSLFCALLLAKAREAIPGDPAESWSLADAVLASNERSARYEARPDPEVHAPALAVRGNAARALGRLLDAEVDLEAALELLDHPDVTDPGTPAEVHAYLGSLREDQGRLEEARFLLERSALLYRLLRDTERTARQLLNLGQVHYLTHDAAAAVAVTQKAIDLLGPGAADWLRAYAHCALGFCLHAAGETDRAEAEVDTHEELILKAGDQLANLLVWLRARIAWSRGEPRKAQRLFQEARERALARGIAWDGALVALELALVHLAQGHTRRARTLAEEALPVFAEQEVDRETRAALDLLEAAARQDALTRELLERAVAALERARRGPR